MASSSLAARPLSRPDVASQKLSGFQYVPLTRPNEIRVLYFDNTEDRNPDGPIALNIAHGTLAELKERGFTFTALSYAWGTHPSDRIVKIKGMDFNVTPNLESALRNIAPQSGTSLFWIDAICINQNDIPEKNRQVAMMAEIYAAASLTLVWLGECSAAISEAIAMLEAAEVVCEVNRLPALDLKHTISDSKYDSAWKGVGQLLAAPWWRRMWVIQEITLGQKAMILCGTKTLMFQRLAMGADVAFKDNTLKYIFPVCRNGFTNYWRVQSMMQYRMGKQMGSPIPLAELLENNVSCEASNPRDMVFSLLGLATDTDGAEEFVIDYNLSVEEVYEQVIKFHIRKYKSLDMICHSAHPKRHQNLPSWVPDFLNMKETIASSLATLSRSWAGDAYWYNASGTSTSNDDALTGSNGTLRASAIFFDKITHVGEEFRPADLSDHFERMVTWFRIVARVIGFEREYIGGGSVMDAFNRTLCGDKARSGLRAQRGWRGYEALEDGMEIPNDFRLGPEVAENERREAWVGDAMQAVSLRSCRRRLIITETGYIGLGPPGVEEGDSVSILLGCSVPVVLRPKEDNWWFVGESFVCGVMDGEVLGMTDMAGNGTEPSEEESAPMRYKVEQILLV